MLRQRPWRTAAKAVAGFAVAFAVWWGVTPAYDSALAAPAQPAMRAFERPPVTRLRAEGREIIVDRADFPVRSARPGVPAADLTFNFIIMTTLFAAGPRTFSNRNVVGFLLAGAALYVTQVLGLIATVQSIYALKLGPWSAANYGPVARNLWGAAAHFYRLVGLYAFAFGFWWLFRDSQGGASVQPAPRRRKKR